MIYKSVNSEAVMFLSTVEGHPAAITINDFYKKGGQVASFINSSATRFIVSMLSNSVEWDLIDYACSVCGFTHVALHPLLEKNLLHRILDEVRPGFIFVSHTFNKVEAGKWINQNGANTKLISLIGKKEIGEFYSFTSDFKEEVPGALNDEIVHTIIYTSGSTGLAKGVKLTNANIRNAISMFSKAKFLKDCHKALSILPIALSGERKMNMVYKSNNISICYPSPNQSLAEALLFFKPDVFAVVPFMLNQIKEVIEKESFDFSFIKAIVCGGATIPVATLNFFKERNLPVYEVYGLTETASVISFNDAGATKPGSVGRVAEGCEVKIAATGEILCKGPQISTGYFKRPQADAELFDTDGWLKTGDIGNLDEDGFLTICGRLKNQFKTSKGMYISPEYIEQLLKRGEMIEEVVVGGEYEDYPFAMVVLKEENSGMMPEERLIEWIRKCNSILAEPERIMRVYIMPLSQWQINSNLTLSMKVKRADIKEIVKGLKPVGIYEN